MPQIVQLTSATLRREGTPAGLKAARDEFAALHSLRLDRVLASDLLQVLQREIDRGEFYDRTHEGIGRELCLKPGVVSGVLELLINDPQLFAVVEEITGCASIGCFEGRVYRFTAGAEHHDSWHSDVGQDRLVGLSLNLGREPYEGGTFQIRKADAGEVLRELPNTRAGDAIVFRIDPALRHRVTSVRGREPKTAYAGWFRRRPDFTKLYRERYSAGRPGATPERD